MLEIDERHRHKVKLEAIEDRCLVSLTVDEWQATLQLAFTLLFECSIYCHYLDFNITSVFFNDGLLPYYHHLL